MPRLKESSFGGFVSVAVPGGRPRPVVDGNADFRDTLGMLLEIQQAEVRTAGAVKEGLGLLAGFKPNVVVSDFLFPEQSGCRLIRQMREAGSTAPAIAVTACIRPEAERMCLEAGFEEVLWKPVEPWVLLERIARLTVGLNGGSGSRRSDSR